MKPAMSDTVHGSAYADNWFAMYVNGKLVAVDSIDFLPHNVVSLDILPEYPMTIAVMAKDNADPKTGLEYGDHIGDGGFIIKSGTSVDVTAKDSSWLVNGGVAYAYAGDTGGAGNVAVNLITRNTTAEIGNAAKDSAGET